MPRYLRLTQVKSGLDKGSRQRGTLRALGLKRVGHTVQLADRPEIRGMVNAISHLLEVEEIEE